MFWFSCIFADCHLRSALPSRSPYPPPSLLPFPSRLHDHHPAVPAYGPASRPQDCDCDAHCEKCSIVLTLNAKCTEDRTMEVTTKDLIIESQDGGVDNYNNYAARFAATAGQKEVGEPVTCECLERQEQRPWCKMF